ncbi:hypothetical protein HMPREF1141_2504 [Clostridium sp. MSTE9]|nr:hypothetical protein HMPREF1141_2504 [Clostridium sp. MSTE9]
MAGMKTLSLKYQIFTLMLFYCSDYHKSIQKRQIILFFTSFMIKTKSKSFEKALFTY